MKQTDLFRIRGFLLVTMLICGCGKTLLHADLSPLIKSTSNGISYCTNDPKLSPFYGDSLLYMRSNEPSGYLIAPLNDLGLGTYTSWPAGLSIDARTGVIDLSATEPGARYNIGFVNTLTHDTAFRQLTIAGAGYLDGIYDMSSGDSLLRPYFNANPAMTSVGDGSQGGIKAIFDCMPFSPRANEAHLKIDIGSGVIDLKNSVLQGGVFGANPQNGDTREMTIYYKLDDQSNMSLQKTSVILHYYHSLSDVPASLINSIQAARASFLGDQVINGPIINESQNSTVMTYSSGNQIVTSSSGGSTGGTTKAGGGSGGPGQGSSPRPPHLCIINIGH